MVKSYIPHAQRKAVALGEMTAYIPDDQVQNFTDAYLPWQDNTDYKARQCVAYDGKFWLCAQDHKSSAIANWYPGVAPSLWSEIGDPGEEWPEWKPFMGIILYNKGSKVTYQGSRYISDIDNNSWAPDVHGWRKA